jgi:hypothetical protein
MMPRTILRLISHLLALLFSLAVSKGLLNNQSTGMLADREPNVLPIENMLGRSLIIHLSYTYLSLSSTTWCAKRLLMDKMLNLI